MTQKTHGNGSSHSKTASVEQDLFQNVREQGEAVKEVVQDYAERAMEELENVPKLIKKYPVQSVLVGFGIGIIGGIFLRKAMEK